MSSSQSEALRFMLAAIRAMREAGYNEADIRELVGEAFQHLDSDADHPHAYGHCLNCGRAIIGWSAYQWSTLVREPCPNCGKPW